MYNDLFQFIRDWYQTRNFIPLHEPRFGTLDREYVMDAIDSTFVSSIGEYVDRFERQLASYVGTSHAVVTVNGTSALQVALRLVGVRPNDEVITQSLTFIATANAIVYNNAHPVFIDVDRDTLGMSPTALETFLNEFAKRKDGTLLNRSTNRRIAAIVPMHTFGHPCDINSIAKISDRWGIPIVEDSAEAIGSYSKGVHCGTIGKFGVFSFNGNKTITSGGGGAIVTNDEHLAKQAKHLTTTAKTSHPWEYIHDDIGYNYRMPNLNAALALAQLEQLGPLLADKRNLALAYRSLFKKIEWGKFVSETPGCQSNYWLNAVIVLDEKQRDNLLEISNASGVMTRPIWRLMPDLRMFKQCQTDALINSRWLQKRIVNLPSSSRKIYDKA